MVGEADHPVGAAVQLEGRLPAATNRREGGPAVFRGPSRLSPWRRFSRRRAQPASPTPRRRPPPARGHRATVASAPRPPRRRRRLVLRPPPALGLTPRSPSPQV